MGRPVVDRDLCVGCGLCVEICPAVFRLGEDGLAEVVNGAGGEEGDCCAEAADSCPSEAIKI